MSVVSDIMSPSKAIRSRPRILPQPVLKLAKSERTRAAILDGALEFLWEHPFVPWFTGTGEVTGLLRQSLEALVRTGYEKGPILKAVADAAPNDERLETAWFEFLSHFDEAVAARIEEDQRQRLISELDAAAIARALNRLDAYSLIEAFGQHPRKKPGPTLGAIERIWISTLYDWRRRDGKTPLIRRSDELTAASE
ncbi:MAG: hypothetical protein P8Y74_16640 [Desulfobacterales bacterium]